MTMLSIALSDSAGPRYKQIADQLASLIDNGSLEPNTKLPTHRALADQLGVTVGTVTRAYAEAERRGLIEARVGAGTYVCSKESNHWSFDTVESSRLECHFGYNVPPLLDRSEMLNRAMQALAANPTALNQLMLYQLPEGILQHREVVAGWLNTLGVNLDAERLLFSSGAQHATQMTLDAYCRAGDTLLVEKYSYPGLISLARQHQLTLKPVEMDAEGIIPSALEAACKLYQPRLFYCMPTLHNPTTATMSPARRLEILAVCRKHNLYLIEDEVNGLLPAERPAPLVNLDPEQVIHIGGLSKCLAPGLRVGYIQVPKRLYTQMTTTLQNHSWMTSPLLTGIAAELIHCGDADRVLQQIRSEMDARLAITQEILGCFNIRTAPGCFHVWLTLPEHLRLGAFVAATANAGISLKSAELFVPPGGAVPPAVRLSISSPANREILTAGLLKIKALLEDQGAVGFSL
jgi:DNA-binding transcriptional MocR family regulator